MPKMEILDKHEFRNSRLFTTTINIITSFAKLNKKTGQRPGIKKQVYFLKTNNLYPIKFQANEAPVAIIFAKFLFNPSFTTITI